MNNNKDLIKSSNKSFFCQDEVAISCQREISNRFETLLLEHNKRQQDLADFLGLDKGYISRVCHGLQLPPFVIRLKIAKFFNTDSSLIWRVKDLNYLNKLKKEMEKNER